MAQHPLSAFHFTVQWGGTRIGFTEVSGLDIFFEPIQFRDGSSKEHQFKKMPGLIKYNNITLKRGLMTGDTEFIDWINTIEMNAVERRDITIQLLNENHEPVSTWQVKNAFPIRYSGPKLNANANTIAIEELELAHEGLSLRK